MSGQIGLIPGSMSLPKPANFAAECRLALRHVTRVLCAMDADISLFKALQVCFAIQPSAQYVDHLLLLQFQRSCALYAIRFILL